MNDDHYFQQITCAMTCQCGAITSVVVDVKDAYHLSIAIDAPEPSLAYMAAQLRWLAGKLDHYHNGTPQ